MQQKIHCGKSQCYLFHEVIYENMISTFRPPNLDGDSTKTFTFSTLAICLMMDQPNPDPVENSLVDPLKKRSPNLVIISSPRPGPLSSIMMAVAVVHLGQVENKPISSWHLLT